MQIAVKPEHDSDQCRRRRQKPPERDPVIPSFGGFDRRPTSGLKRPPMTPPADARNRRQLRRPVEARSASPIRRPQLHGRLSYQRTSSSEQSRLPRRGLPPTTTPLPLANPVAKSSLPLHAKPAELLTPEHGRNEESAGRSPGSTGSRLEYAQASNSAGKKEAQRPICCAAGQVNVVLVQPLAVAASGLLPTVVGPGSRRTRETSG